MASLVDCCRTLKAQLRADSIECGAEGAATIARPSDPTDVRWAALGTQQCRRPALRETRRLAGTGRLAASQTEYGSDGESEARDRRGIAWRQDLQQRYGQAHLVRRIRRATPELGVPDKGRVATRHWLPVDAEHKGVTANAALQHPLTPGIVGRGVMVISNESVPPVSCAAAKNRRPSVGKGEPRSLPGRPQFAVTTTRPNVRSREPCNTAMHLPT